MTDFTCCKAWRPCLLVLGLLLGGAPLSGHAQSDNRWVFVGTLTQEKVSPCLNPVNTRYHYQWMAAGPAYAEQRKTLDDSLKQSLGSGRFMVQTFGVTAGTEQYIAVVEKSRKCSSGGQTRVVPNYIFYAGRSKEDIEAQMASDKRIYSENVSYQIIRLIDCQAELGRRGTPPAAAASKQTVSKDLGGVVATFTQVTKASGGDFVVAKFANRTSKQLATVLVKSAGGALSKEELAPGATSTRRYEGKALEVQVLYRDYEAPAPDFSLLDFVKDKVREQVTISNGQLQVRPAASSGTRQ